MPTSAVARAAKRPANRRAWAQRNRDRARTGEDQVIAAYDWFRAELAACTGDTRKPAAWLAGTIWKAAERLNQISEEENRRGR